MDLRKDKGDTNKRMDNFVYNTKLSKMYPKAHFGSGRVTKLRCGTGTTCTWSHRSRLSGPAVVRDLGWFVLPRAARKSSPWPHLFTHLLNQAELRTEWWKWKSIRDSLGSHIWQFWIFFFFFYYHSCFPYSLFLVEYTTMKIVGAVVVMEMKKIHGNGWISTETKLDRKETKAISVPLCEACTPFLARTPASGRRPRWQVLPPLTQKTSPGPPVLLRWVTSERWPPRPAPLSVLPRREKNGKWPRKESEKALCLFLIHGDLK